MRIAGGRADFENAVADVEDRNVERAAAEIEHHDRFVLLFVESVGQRRRRGLIDDAEHVEAGDLAGVFGRLALRVVEICRHGDHRVVDFLAQIFGRVVGELAQHLRRNFFGRILLAHDFKAHGVVGTGDDFVRHVLDLRLDFGVAPSDKSFGRVDRVLRVEHRLAFGNLADQPSRPF